MDRYVCIHGHFYQPPRENPWLEAIELQDSALPVPRLERADHRRVLRAQRRGAHPRRRGPHRRDRQQLRAHQLQLRADAALAGSSDKRAGRLPRDPRGRPREPRRASRGHGSAMAQVYNHIIMPLANERDRRTQVALGHRATSRHRFGREPEGMWLPETAVDVAIARGARRAGHPVHGPRAAPGRRVRRAIGEAEWQRRRRRAASTRAGRTACALPSGRSIAIFFYDGPISRAVAFERLLLARRALRDRLTRRVLATRARAAARPHRDRRRDVRPPPPPRRHGARVRARAHRGERARAADQLRRVPGAAPAGRTRSRSSRTRRGAARTASSAGAATAAATPAARRAGTRSGARRCARRSTGCATRSRRGTSEAAGALFPDPWAARDAYVDVILDRSAESVDALPRASTRARALAPAERVRALQLLEMQRHAHAHVHELRLVLRRPRRHRDRRRSLQYAGRALQLAEELFGAGPRGALPRAPVAAPAATRRTRATAGRSTSRRVRPAMVSLERVGAHYAVSSLFSEYEDVVAGSTAIASSARSTGS